MVDHLQEEKLFFPVPGITIDDLLDWNDNSERFRRHLIHQNQNEVRLITDVQINGNPMHMKYFGTTLTLNDEKIALFRLGEKVYAIQAECPHLRGPLYLGDIEELAPGQMCLKCPSHKWKFDIQTGECVIPRERGVLAKTYPVRVKPDGKISVGFDSFGPSAFVMDF